jgi:hypothetical protein
MRDAMIYRLTGKYLAEPHLGGKSHIVQIEKVEIHEFERIEKDETQTGKVKRRKIKKTVLFFAGKELPLGLTAVCNLLTVIGLYSRDMDKWIGKFVQLDPKTCDAFGNKHTPCIRISNTIPTVKELNSNESH